ncbi:MAG TPA: fused MFS/spermidine synthase [Bryobacteraceae bacterium]|nr:fused MFS/spermidine synthase [Bryobacteraceae bacterium]
MPTDSAAPVWFPLLLVLFAGSGCSALIYEIVWLQLLQLVIGSTAVSLGVLLATFMGGLCLGSLALPRLVPAHHHPLRVYALLELGTGVLALAVWLAAPLVDRVYVTAFGHGLPSILLRAVVAAACLLPPTLLMGASLPAIARWVETSPRGVARLGLLYGANIAGAVFGCLLAGFYLLRVHDMLFATLVAAGLNALVALISAALATRARGAGKQTASTSGASSGVWRVYGAIALSGLCALGAEVVWTRLLSLILGATVYTFSIILAVFLVGLGIGSAVGALLCRSTISPRVALGWCQFLLVAAVAWSAYMITRSLPYWPINAALSQNPWLLFQLDLLRCAWPIFPAACLWGASFPLALAGAAAPGQDPGRLTGTIYAANTLGAIAGALGFSMLLIPWLGTQASQRLLVILSAAAAWLMFAPCLRRLRSAAGLACATAAALLLAAVVPDIPGAVLAYGRELPSTQNLGKVLYRGEGMNASIAITEQINGSRFFHISGKTEASSQPQDMRLQNMLGHLPALIHANPRSVLVVGCGAGVTAGTFVLYPSVQSITICEIERLIPPAVARYFAKQNHNVVHDPRTHVVFDDARHFTLTTPQRFDIITSDPIHPWVKGMAALYSKEYFELCRRHLNPGGIVTQWVPLYESDLSTVKSEIATFFDVFPNGTVWSNDIAGEGYDLVLLGQAEPTHVDVDAVDARLARADYERVLQALHEVGFSSAVGLFSTYAGQASDLDRWLTGAAINRDRNLRLQYLAGMGLNVNRAWDIYDDLLRYREYPEGMFTTAPATGQALRAALQYRGEGF